MVSAIGLFNNIGSRLVMKKTIPIVKLKNAPNIDGAISVDFVKVETKFGDCLTKITSYKDKDGKLIKRYIVKTQKGKPKETIVSDYDGSFNTKRTKSSKFFVGNKKVKEETTFDNVSEEIFTDNETYVRPVLARLKSTLKFGKNERKEEQLFQTISNKDQDYRIETSATRLKDGSIINNDVTSNVASTEQIDELKAAPFMFDLTLDDKNFLEAILKDGMNRQKVSNVVAKIKNLKGGELGYSMDYSNKLCIDLVAHKGDRPNLVNTVNHELRHQYQKKYIGIKAIFRYLKDIFIKNKLLEEDKYAKDCLIADIKYPSLFVMMGKYNDKYYNNFLEVDAKNAGKKAADAYDQTISKIIEILPNIKKAFLSIGQFNILKLLTEAPKVKIEGLYK